MSHPTGPASPKNNSLMHGEPLTSREIEAMDYLVQGFTNREIGVAMHITTKGVESHIQNIMYKLGLGRRVLLALYWAKL